MRAGLQIGTVGSGVVNHDPGDYDLDTQFRMVKESGVFDYFEKTPAPGEIDRYLQARDRYQLPVRAGSFYYVLGRDEPLLRWHLRVAKELGSIVQNVQIQTNDIDGARVTDERLAETYLWAAELGEQLGVAPCFEVHVNMWSENFARVVRVGELVEARGVKFNITLDHSHVIFKIDNPAEQEIQGLRAEIDSGAVELDPYDALRSAQSRPGVRCDRNRSSRNDRSVAVLDRNAQTPRCLRICRKRKCQYQDQQIPKTVFGHI